VTREHRSFEFGRLSEFRDELSGWTRRIVTAASRSRSSRFAPMSADGMVRSLLLPRQRSKLARDVNDEERAMSEKRE